MGNATFQVNYNVARPFDVEASAFEIQKKESIVLVEFNVAHPAGTSDI